MGLLAHPQLKEGFGAWAVASPHLLTGHRGCDQTVLSARAGLVREHCSHHDPHVLIKGTANPSQVDRT